MNNSNDETGPQRPGRTILKLPDDLRAELQREAFASNRTLTAEITMRLRATMKEPSSQALRLAEPAPQSGLSELDAKMLEVFRRMSPEKQLALLSLFK